MSVAGVVFSDDNIYVKPTAPVSPSLNATCDLGSLIAEIGTETEMSSRDVVFNYPAIDNHAHPLLKEECRRNPSL